MAHTKAKRCSKEKPMPPGARGMTYIHSFKTVDKGYYFDTLRCPHCGFEVKCVPK